MCILTVIDCSETRWGQIGGNMVGVMQAVVSVGPSDGLSWPPCNLPASVNMRVSALRAKSSPCNGPIETNLT